MAFRDLVDDLHTRLERRGWPDVRAPYGFVMLAVRDAPMTGTDLALLMGISKQAASKLVESMSDAGLVTRSPGVDDARQRVVQLTDRGRDLLEDVEAVYAELDREWAAVVGEGAVQRLRHDVTAVLLARHDGRLPPIRPGW